MKSKALDNEIALIIENCISSISDIDDDIDLADFDKDFITTLSKLNINTVKRCIINSEEFNCAANKIVNEIKAAAENELDNIKMQEEEDEEIRLEKEEEEKEKRAKQEAIKKANLTPLQKRLLKEAGIVGI